MIHSLNSFPVTPYGAPAAAAAPLRNEGPEDSVQLNLSQVLQETAEEAASLETKLAEHYEGEVLVKLKPGMTLQGMEDFASRYGASLIERFRVPDQMLQEFGGDLVHLKLADGMTTAQAIAALEKDSQVAYACANDVLKATEQKIPNDLDNRLWGMRNIEAPEAWNVTTGKREGGPVVCVIDTGVDYNHPDLRNNMWRNPGEVPGDGIDNDGNGLVDDVFGINSFANNGNPLDDHSHGSHCSGSIAGEGNNGQGVVGVNWEGQIMAAKFLSGSGSGSTAGAIKAVMYATEKGARITSNSWGGGGFNQALYDSLKASPALHIFAAGNESNNNDSSPAYPASYDLGNIVSVAALDSRDRLASFSNYGATTVDIGAPGVDIYSTVKDGRYGSMSGTSMACPHVSGVAALVVSAFPNASNEEIKDRLLRGAIPIPALSGKALTGGKLNAKNALENDQTPPSAPANFGSRTVNSRLVSLGWVAPGDDGTEGNASSYELRMSDQPITDEASFQRATLIPTARPQSSGLEENARVDLTPSGSERTLHFALKAVDNAGNGSDLSSAQVQVPAARVAFEDNADGGAEKWTAQGTWAQVEMPGRGKVWTDSPGGNYGNKKDWSVTSQSFSLAGMTGSRLYFDLKHQMEERHDNLFVEASQDGGRRWSPLANFTGDSDWKKQSIDLSAFDGKDVQVRFRLKTDRSITADGVYFDNVVVAGND